MGTVGIMLLLVEPASPGVWGAWPELNRTMKQGRYLPSLMSNLSLKISATEIGMFIPCTGQQASAYCQAAGG